LSTKEVPPDCEKESLEASELSSPSLSLLDEPRSACPNFASFGGLGAPYVPGIGSS